jgi:hypothetical protein
MCKSDDFETTSQQTADRQSKRSRTQITELKIVCKKFRAVSIMMAVLEVLGSFYPQLI